MKVFLFSLSQECRCRGTEPGRLCRHAPLRRNVTRFKKPGSPRSPAPELLSIVSQQILPFNPSLSICSLHLSSHLSFLHSLLYLRHLLTAILSAKHSTGLLASPLVIYTPRKGVAAPSTFLQSTVKIRLPIGYPIILRGLSQFQLALALHPSRFPQCHQNAFQEKVFSRSLITAPLAWPIHETPPLTYP